jgi:hypothetical protein
MVENNAAKERIVIRILARKTLMRTENPEKWPATTDFTGVSRVGFPENQQLT